MPLQLRGFGVSVLCDDKELPQYHVEMHGDATITCYIPSEAGKTFKVILEDYAQSHGKRCSLYLDGKLAVKYRSAATNKRLSFKGIYTSDTSLSLFSFSTIPVTDDDDAMPLDATSDIGVIELRVHRGARGKMRTKKNMKTVVPGSSKAGRKTLSPHPVSEKSKLIGSHCVVLGPSVQVSPAGPSSSSAYKWVTIDPEDRPYASFRFRHLSKDVLLARGIMSSRQREEAYSSGTGPANGAKSSLSVAGGSSSLERRSSQEESTSIKREPRVKYDPDDLNDDEVRIQRLEEELAASRKGVQAVEAELALARSRTAGSANAKLKRERSATPIRVGEWDGTVIDLTSD
ncbi:hypothetical protein BV25DRAFT_1921123 [Artomyces pyxidatus]|uniref:Uncharacterized protein n=1 Tax=Artomyces pyxidatus TaxID=48021 RepID=A0ACB8SIP1_9AGAM|nr:hypothetical protein BV25DRAFT_1921123 [Artomyces pyxidatus]